LSLQPAARLSVLKGIESKQSRQNFPVPPVFASTSNDVRHYLKKYISKLLKNRFLQQGDRSLAKCSRFVDETPQWNISEKKSVNFSSQFKKQAGI
jgi:hypothetical protein